MLPGNLFYGTTIPGAIVFFNKAKPEAHRNKILMVYAAKEGWYREEPNMNVLLRHDMLRISTISESWGDLALAQAWIEGEKARLRSRIQTDLDFKLGEIDEEFDETIATLSQRLKAAKEKAAEAEALGRKLTAAQAKTLQAAEAALQKIMAQKEQAVTLAHKIAEGERKAIDDVEGELLQMLQDPELRKRYFAVVDMEELEENEFNLNIPRYVDTFEPEEEIDLKDAIEEFNYYSAFETETDNSLNELLKNMN